MCRTGKAPASAVRFITGRAPGPLRNSTSSFKLFSTGMLAFGEDVNRLAGATPLGFVAVFAMALSSVPAPAREPHRHRDAPERLTGPSQPDLSARKRLGTASYYARQFFGRHMADGAPMNPRGNNAASRTLPLGTVAKVTDVTTGKSAIVKIEDRGPYIKGRIVDLSPSTAQQIGITPHIGVAQVMVEPIAVPLPDGRIRLGSAASDQATPHRRLSRPRFSALSSHRVFVHPESPGARRQSSSLP